MSRMQEGKTTGTDRGPTRMVRGRQDVQRTGTIIAGGVGVLFLGVIGWYVMHAGPGAAPLPSAPQGPRARPNSALGESDPGVLQLSEGEGVQIDLMDKKDLRRQTGLLKFDSLEPLEARHFAAAKPDAWLYTKKGQTVHITAATGKLYMPERDKEPESGTLSGGVVVTVYQPREDGAKIDPAVDEPSLTFKTETLNFDSTLGKMSTTDRVTIVSEAADLNGNGMDVLFNQVQQRLELLKIGAGDNSAVLHPGGGKQRAKRAPGGPKPAAVAAAPQGRGAAPVAQAAAPAAAAAPGKAQAKTPVETLYRVDFDQHVSLVQGGRKLDADLLQVWARLIDGNLPEGAIAQVKGQAAEPPPVRTAAASGAPPTAPVTTAATPPPQTPLAGGGDITLRWTGPCTIAPLSETPAELKSEQVAARFTAPGSGVKLSDAEHGASGHAGAIEYGATTGKLLLVADNGVRPRLEWPNAGTIETERIEGDLTHGLIHIPAAGTLRHVTRGAEIRWGEQADFTLNIRDGAVVGELKQATFAGGFASSDKNASIAGGFARADFASTPEQPSSLIRLIVTDKAVATSDKSGRLACDSLDVGFALPAAGQKAGDPDPRIATATGHVVVEQKDSRLSADWLEARLAKTQTGAVDVTSAAARGSVRISRESDHILALADEMRADLSWTPAWNGKTGAESDGDRRQVVDLIGTKVDITRDERSSLTATQVRLDGVAHSVEVFGAGTFAHNDPEKKAVVTASWNTGMTFFDNTGKLECTGDARAISTPDAMSRDEIEADRLKLALRPHVNDEPASQDGQPKPSPLLRAEAIGSVLDREGGVNARVTSERFSPDGSSPEGRRREQLQYLEGPKIVADNEAGTLDVPAAGMLVLSDRRAGNRPAASDPGSSSLSQPGTKGDSLFNWAGSLHMERESGRLEMHDGVHLTHRAVRDAQITNLDCANLTATARTKGPTTEGATLTSAVASGAVYVTVGPEATKAQPRPLRKELVADKVDYDAVKGSVDATAAAGGLVSMFDPAKGVPVNATRLIWELNSGRVEVKNLEPIVGPR